jgi:hypothetical protein
MAFLEQNVLLVQLKAESWILAVVLVGQNALEHTSISCCTPNLFIAGFHTLSYGGCGAVQ